MSSAARPDRTAEAVACKGQERCRATGTVGSPLRVGNAVHWVERVEITVLPEGYVPPSGPAEDEIGLCNSEEFWLFARSDSGELLDHQMVTGGCTGDDAGERWCGLPPSATVEVKGERVEAHGFAPQFACMGAFRSDVRVSVSLRTFELLAEESSLSHSLAGYSNGSAFDWQRLSGTETFYYAGGGDDPGDCGEVSSSLRVIPAFKMPDGYLHQGFDTASITGCATRFLPTEGSPRSGLAPTELHAVVDTRHVLLLELLPAVPPSASARFEVCQGEAPYYDSSYCQYPNPEPSSCLTFDRDGRVHGSTRGAPSAFIEKAKGELRFKLALASSSEALRLEYRDPVNKDRISTSRAKASQLFSLSRIENLEPRAACEWNGSRLSVRPLRGDRRRALTAR
jgi:hypothetical protein